MIVKSLLPVLLALAAAFPFASVLADNPATASSLEAAGNTWQLARVVSYDHHGSH
jgi:hypothetical protein